MLSVVRRITMAAALSLAILQAYAAPPPATDGQKKIQAQHDFLKCAIKHEPEVDDRTSEASKIALALTNRCITEYNVVTDIWFSGSPDPQVIREWKQKRATSQAKIDASLDIVVSMRAGTKPNPNF
jgi:hypothetical protein